MSHPDGTITTVPDVDVVFPILHGPFGEDGTIQGLLEIAGLPYVGDGVLASALAMDKHVAKAVLEHAGLRVAPWTTVLRREWAADPVDVAEAVAAHGWPLFVKPARAGSSMGVSRVDEPSQLGAAMDLAFEHDSKVIVEPRVIGREVEVAVLEGRDGVPRTSLPGEIVVAEDGFYDFASKYLGGDESLLCPAPLTEAETDSIRSIGARAFEAIGGAGLARVDCFLTDDGFVVNEVNTMPGSRRCRCTRGAGRRPGCRTANSSPSSSSWGARRSADAPGRVGRACVIARPESRGGRHSSHLRARDASPVPSLGRVSWPQPCTSEGRGTRARPPAASTRRP